jgi:hypothetical protein
MDISDYKTWIIDKLISRDPKITQDFKALELSQELIPDNFRHLKAIPEKVLIPLHTSLIESGDYDKAVNLLADMNGKMVSYIPIADGITHINVYSKGKTKLGRALTNFSNIEFVHPQHGKFASVEGFWYWLGTGKTHDQLRTLYGYEAKEIGRKLPKVDVCNFEQQIKAAIFYKVEQNPGLWNALKESELPFSHYYFYGTPLNCKIIANDDAKWFIDYLELVRLHTKGLAQKVIIAGSRSVVEETTVAQALTESKFNPVLIVSGGARGVDRLGEDVALKLGLPVRHYIPDWDGLGKRAGMVRNADMGNYADALVACWDNQSSGTKGMIDYMKRINKPSFVKTVEPTPLLNQSQSHILNLIPTQDQDKPSQRQPTKEECILRRKWLVSARLYYLFAGVDSGMSDYDWDKLARELFSKKDIFADCKILNDPTYQGGSLYWVNKAKYQEELEKYKPQPSHI